MKIGFFGVKHWEKEILEREIAILPVYGVGIFEEEVQDNLERANDYDIISTFIYSEMSAKVLAQLPKLKLIATRSTGIDHIDALYCRKNKIEIAGVPEYGSRTVAEYTFGLLLAVAKKIVVAHQSVEDGDFSPEGLTGVDLYKKTIGIVGTGKIGQNVARFAKAFGMNVLAVDVHEDLRLAKRLGFRYVDLPTCLASADFLTLHVPAVAKTYHLINKKNIGLMKRGSVLINTCRGPVVETEALLWALNKKILAGVGLDVVEEEQRLESLSVITDIRLTKNDLQNVISFHMLRDRDDVVFTPHNAFNTQEAIGRIIATTVENINEYIKLKD